MEKQKIISFDCPICTEKNYVELDEISKTKKCINNCGLEYVFFEKEKKRNKEYNKKYLCSKKKKIKINGYFGFFYLPIPEEKIKFLKIDNIFSIIDKDILSVLLKGLSNELEQPIRFKCSNDTTIQIPEDDYFLNGYVCKTCKKNMIKTEKPCEIVRSKEVHEKDFIQSEKSNFYLCNIEKGGLHLHYPVFIDGKYLGLIITGTGRFNKKYIFDELKKDLKKLNSDFENERHVFFTKYKLKWYDKKYNKEGLNINPENIVEIKSKFESIAKKIITLLNNSFVGRVREASRNSVRILIRRLFPDDSNFEPKYGIRAFYHNFRNGFNFIRTNCIDLDSIVLYDNFILPTRAKILNKTIISGGNNLPNELTINKYLENYFQEEEMFFWSPKDEYEYFKDSKNKIVINKDNKLFINNKIKINEYITENIFSGEFTPFYVFFPILVNHKSKEMAFILFKGKKETISYNSSLLRYLFLRFFDILKMAINYYYDETFNEKYLKKLSHDLNNPAGGIFNISEDILTDYNSVLLAHDTLKRKIKDIKLESELLLDFADKLFTISDKDFSSLDLFFKTKLNFYNLVYLPIIHLPEIKYSIESKKLFIKQSDDFYNIPKIYVNKENIRRIFKNILTNAIKYSFPYSIIKINYYTKNNKVIIVISNLTYKIKYSEKKLLFKEEKQLSNSKLFFNFNKELKLKKGRGLGLKISKELIESMNGSIELYESFPDEKDLNLLRKFNIDINKVIRFEFHLFLEKI